ncbi:MAG: hypothetical protein U1E36_03215 [Rickettsiales bacterium]
MSASTEGTLKRELLIFFYKYRLRLALAFLIPLIIIVAISFVPTPRYTASSVLLVRLGSEYVYQPESNTGNGPPSVIPFNVEQIFKAEVAILGSYDLHKRLVEEMGVETLYPNLIKPSGIRLFASNLKDITEAKINAMLGIVPKKEPKLSEEEQKKQRVAKAVEIFEKRFSIFLEKESAVINISYEHADPEVAVATLDKLLNIYFEKRKALYLEPRAELAKKEVTNSRGRVLWANRAVDNFKRTNMIFSLQDQRTELLKRRADLERQLSILVNPDLERQIADINIQLDELDAKEHTYNNLKREADVAEKSYDMFTNKYDEANSYDTFQKARADSVRMIQNPAAAPEPKSIQMLIILGGVFLSIISTLLVAAISEFSRSGYLTPEHVERHLGLPVLAAIPHRRRR